MTTPTTPAAERPTYQVADRYTVGSLRPGGRRSAVTLATAADGLGALAVVECGGAIARKSFRGETAYTDARRWADDTGNALARNGER